MKYDPLTDLWLPAPSNRCSLRSSLGGRRFGGEFRGRGGNGENPDILEGLSSVDRLYQFDPAFGVTKDGNGYVTSMVDVVNGWDAAQATEPDRPDFLERDPYLRYRPSIDFTRAATSQLEVTYAAGLNPSKANGFTLYLIAVVPHSEVTGSPHYPIGQWDAITGNSWVAVYGRSTGTPSGDVSSFWIRDEADTGYSVFENSNETTSRHGTHILRLQVNAGCTTAGIRVGECVDRTVAITGGQWNLPSTNLTLGNISHAVGMCRLGFVVAYDGVPSAGEDAAIVAKLRSQFVYDPSEETGCVVAFDSARRSAVDPIVNHVNGSTWTKTGAAAVYSESAVDFADAPAYDFPATGHYIAPDGSVGQLNGEAMAIVLVADQQVASKRILGSMVSGSETDGFVLGTSAGVNAELQLKKTGETTLIAASVGAMNARAHVVGEADLSTGAASLWMDGALEATATEVGHIGSTATQEALRLGASFNGSIYTHIWNDEVHALWLFGVIPSAATYRRIADYLDRSQAGNGKALKFEPEDFKALAWINADDVLVTGSGVSTAIDKTGNGNDFTQSTDADRPSLDTASAAYGLTPLMGYDGLTEWLDGLDFGDADGTTDLTVLAVCTRAVQTGQRVIVAKRFSTQDGWQLRTEAPNAKMVADDTAANIDTVAMSADTPSIVRGEIENGVGVEVFVDGTGGGQVAVALGDMSNAVNVTIGTQDAGANHFEGGIWEVIILDYNPTAAQRAGYAQSVNARTGLAIAGA